MPAKECGVDEGKSEWQPMPQEVTLWIFPCLGWDGIGGCGRKLERFPSRTSRGKLKLSVARLELRGQYPRSSSLRGSAGWCVAGPRAKQEDQVQDRHPGDLTGGRDSQIVRPDHSAYVWILLDYTRVVSAGLVLQIDN